ncbi:MAG: hypothetical protein KC933_41465, partial [Myxococcales bacterium]|nr:hypothetical protein [Myxococcales bacterium]
MSTPRPWRERPESPEDAQAAALLERLSSPDAPTGAQARVWRRLGEPAPARPWLVPALGAGAVAVAAALWL